MIAGAAAFVAMRSWAAGPAGAAGAGGAGATAKVLPAPSLSETGKIGSSKLEGEPPPKSIRPAPKVARPEPPVAASPSGGGAPATTPAPPTKIPVPRAVQEEITVRLRALNACRIEVARDKHRPPKEVRAGTLLLRWSIGLDGSVSGAEAVEMTPVDPDVMECARQTIAKWKFPAPDRGPLAIERRYRFPS